MQYLPKPEVVLSACVRKKRMFFLYLGVTNCIPSLSLHSLLCKNVPSASVPVSVKMESSL